MMKNLNAPLMAAVVLMAPTLYGSDEGFRAPDVRARMEHFERSAQVLAELQGVKAPVPAAKTLEMSRHPETFSQLGVPTYARDVRALAAHHEKTARVFAQLRETVSVACENEDDLDCGR